LHVLPAIVVTGQEAAEFTEIVDVDGGTRIVDHDCCALLVDRRVDGLIPLLRIAIDRGLGIATIAAFALPRTICVTDVFVLLLLVTTIRDPPEERVIVKGSLNVVGQDSVIIQVCYAIPVKIGFREHRHVPLQRRHVASNTISSIRARCAISAVSPGRARCARWSSRSGRSVVSIATGKRQCEDNDQQSAP